MNFCLKVFVMLGGGGTIITIILKSVRCKLGRTHSQNFHMGKLVWGKHLIVQVFSVFADRCKSLIGGPLPKQGQEVVWY